MFISFQKLFIKKNPPLSVEKLSVAVSKKYIIREFTTKMFCQKVLEFIRELGTQMR